MKVVRLRDEFERDPPAFVEKWKRKDGKIRRQILSAKERLANVDVPDATLQRASELCLKLGTDGLRGELTLIRAARAFAALEGDDAVADRHLIRVAPPALRHRLRRNVLDDAGSTTRVERAVEELFGSAASAA
jgi:magnesium chelatase subunit I